MAKSENNIQKRVLTKKTSISWNQEVENISTDIKTQILLEEKKDLTLSEIIHLALKFYHSKKIK